MRGSGELDVWASYTFISCEVRPLLWGSVYGRGFFLRTPPPQVWGRLSGAERGVDRVMSQMGGFPKTQNEPQRLWRLGLGAAGRPASDPGAAGRSPPTPRETASELYKKVESGAEGRRGDTDERGTVRRRA